ALGWAANSSAEVGRGLQASIALARERLAIAETLNDPALLSDSLLLLGGAFAAAGEKPDEVGRVVEGTTNADRRSGAAFVIARALFGLGLSLSRRGRYAEAKAILEEAYQVWSEIGNLRRKAWLLLNLGYMESEQGNYGEAERLCIEGLRLAKDV